MEKRSDLKLNILNLKGSVKFTNPWFLSTLIIVNRTGFPHLVELCHYKASRYIMIILSLTN